ncbi:MAG: hypothetical protein LBT47_10730 [Deltaproteobacteria bacterium]|nr:hypothetical protein [Deltaproteobacteria bacterium]
MASTPEFAAHTGERSVLVINAAPSGTSQTWHDWSSLASNQSQGGQGLEIKEVVAKDTAISDYDAGLIALSEYPRLTVRVLA